MRRTDEQYCTVVDAIAFSTTYVVGTEIQYIRLDGCNGSILGFFMGRRNTPAWYATTGTYLLLYVASY